MKWRNSPDSLQQPSPALSACLQVGRMHYLEVSHFSAHGAYLADSQHSEVLLPKKFVPANLSQGALLEVFIYTDSLDRLVATTQKPLAQCGEVAVLKVCDIVQNGCFLDLGLDKHVFMPSKNPARFTLGQSVAVFLTRDKQNRLIAKLGIKEHLQGFKGAKNLHAAREALPFERTQLGIGCVVEKKYYGLLYHTELPREIPLFEPLLVQIARARRDGKLDLRLDTYTESQSLLRALQRQGVLNLHYDSTSEEIRALLGISKKHFKKSLTALLQEGKATLKEGKIFKL